MKLCLSRRELSAYDLDFTEFSAVTRHLQQLQSDCASTNHLSDPLQLRKMLQREEPVCCEPKLFVGGLRFDATREEVVNQFQQYGPIKTCVLLHHKDTGKSKGCAMVQYLKWAHAEATVQQLNGTNSALSGEARPMIVKFADPQR